MAAGPPAETTVPSMGKAEGLGVKGWPAAVYTLLGEGSEGVGREIVLVSICNAPFGPRLIVVPLIVTGGPFTETAVPAIEKADGLAVKV